MEAAAGIYTRIIFPDAASDSEPHLSETQKAILDATPDCIKVLSTDGRLLAMNRAGCLALDVPEDSEFGMPWLPLLAEEARRPGLEALREAAEGRNARFPGQSDRPDGTRHWDNLLTPVLDASGRVHSILCVSRDVTAKTLLEKELEDAIGREKLLSREMQHRIKNLFSVVSGLISISEKEAAKADAPETATRILRDKLHALSRASDAALAPSGVENVGAGRIELASLVGSVLRPYGDRCSMVGDAAALRRNSMTTLALFLHELATNSVKYGALGADGGEVLVRWTTSGGALELTWAETGGPAIPASPTSAGFGSEMVDRIVSSGGGAVRRTWRREGLVAELRLPGAAIAPGG